MRNILPLSLFLLSGTASAIALPWPFPAADTIITVGGAAITADAAGFAVGTVTVQPGGPAVTVSGTPLSLASDGELLAGSSTIHLAKLEKRRGKTTVKGKTTTPKATTTPATTTPATTTPATTTPATSVGVPPSSTPGITTSVPSSAPVPVSSAPVSSAPVSQPSSTPLSVSSTPLSVSSAPLSQSSSGLASSSGITTSSGSAISGSTASGSSITSAPSGSSSTVPSGSSSSVRSSSSGVSSSSASASGASTAVIIFPKASAAAAAKTSLSAALKAQLGAANFYAVGSQNNGIVQWTAKANGTYIAALKKNAVVDSIVPNIAIDNPQTAWTAEESEPGLLNVTSGIASDVGIVYDNSTAATTSSSAPAATGALAARAALLKRVGGTITNDPTADEEWDLRMVCQPNIKKKLTLHNRLKYGIDDYKSYFYDSTAGDGVTVYLHDTGLNLANDEIAKLAHTPRWLFPTSTGTTNTDKVDPIGHGTCLASKIAGPTFGVAKKAQLVMVKNPPYNADTKAADNLAAVQMILDDVQTQKKANANFKAVVNLSWGINPTDIKDATDRTNFEDALRTAIQNLFDQGAVVVASAGNDASRGTPIINKLPKILESSTFPLINVGSVGRDGQRASNSQYGPQLTVMAPGDHVRCATAANSAVATRFAYGTSEAAAHVSGLVAYLWALDPNGQFGKQTGANVAKTMKKYLQDTSFNRANEGTEWAEAAVKVGVVSNGVSYKDMGLK